MNRSNCATITEMCSQNMSVPAYTSVPQGRFANQQGFTLLELIIVCLLITVSLAFSVPNLRQALVVDQLAANSRKVIALIKEVRNLAAQKQQPYLISFDLDGKKIWYQQDVPASMEEKNPGTPHPSIQFPSSVRIQDLQIGTAEKKTSGEVALWVNRQGIWSRLSSIWPTTRTTSSVLSFPPSSAP
jgi:prepilin-type N-terminal cleavage/methylation domain-containing protein